MTILREVDCYVDAYAQGVRLRAYPDALDKNLAHMDDGERRYSDVIQRRLNSYIVGFSDGWHGIPPEVTS